MKTIDLAGDWNLIRLADGSSRPMRLPGDIISALVASGEIPPPYIGCNELELQWIGREDWRIERRLELDAATFRFARICLEALVVDTIAEIRINGRLLGESKNMFRRFRGEAKAFLRPGSNTISIDIKSPEEAAKAAAAALPYPVPASEYPVFSPHRNLIRKAQCMAGWDWGPCLMTGGVYDGITLICHDGPRIEYATTRMSHEGGTWSVEVTVDLSALIPGTELISVELAGLKSELLADLALGQSRHRLSLMIKNPELWWPAGYGGQRLYELRVRTAGCELVKKVGFRALEVRAEKDEWGSSLVFVVNGREVFAKGANWIPADALPSACDRKRLGDLLGSAAAANMNMLRVWGGGRYESEDFYELCDEQGILIWQDCMFSCALYPSDPAFLAEVEAEIRHQVLRLKDHACLALWCGNNEALGAITWYEESRKRPPRYIVDYDRLTEGTLGRVVRELDPDRTWWPSSPSAGPNDYSDNWHSDGCGDMHYWSVWHEGKPFSAYLDVKPRFCSEFGFQSFPSERTVASFAPEEERNVTSPTMEHHQRHARGNSLIIETMLRYFRMPSGFRETLYLSQVQQAWAIRTAVDYWRSQRPRCMGSLYWQLNDLWPVSSWSSLEYDGGWKLLHYEARRFYAPLHLALFVQEGRIEAHAIHDGRDPLLASTTLRFRRFDGRQVAEYLVETELDSDSSTLVWSLPLADLPGKPEELYLEGSLEAGGQKSRESLFLAEPKRCTLLDSNLSCRVEKRAEGGLALRIRAEYPAFWVEPSLSAVTKLRGSFGDAGFDLGPGEEILLPFKPLEGEPLPEASKIEADLRILDLASSFRVKRP